MTENYSTIMNFNSKDELLKVWKGMFDNQSNSISLLEVVNVPENIEDKDKWFYQTFGCTFDVCSASIDEEKFEMNLQTESGLTSEIIQKIADMFNVNFMFWCWDLDSYCEYDFYIYAGKPELFRSEESQWQKDANEDIKQKMEEESEEWTREHEGDIYWEAFNGDVTYLD